MEFLIYWAGFPIGKPTYDKEENLDGCTELLAAYAEEYNLNNTVQARYGAPDPHSNGSSLYNPANWVELDKVIKFIENYRQNTKGYNKTTVITTDLIEAAKKDNIIIILGHERHLFVIKIPSDCDTAYIADGTNEIKTDSSLFGSLQKILHPKNLKTVHYGDQTRFDE